MGGGREVAPGTQSMTWLHARRSTAHLPGDRGPERLVPDSGWRRASGQAAKKEAGGRCWRTPVWAGVGVGRGPGSGVGLAG